MQWKLMTFLSISLISSGAAAESAFRDPDTDFSVYETKSFGARPIYETSQGGGSAHSRAKKYNEAELPAATSWNGSLLQSRFEKMRDAKVVDGEYRPSWLYPDDGCFARAAVATRTAFHHFFPLPKKVFAFGNLTVKTPNSPRGKVSWWYHVAPIVQVGDAKYVIDPAIERSRPLLLREWLEAMGTPEKMKVSICDSGTYSPGDRCNKDSDGLELRAINTQRHYLRLEERRLRALNREEEIQ